MFMARRYRCPHCGRSRAAKAATVAHMARCWRDPNNRACLTCKHFDRDFDGYESCDRGVDLTPLPPCERCGGSGIVESVNSHGIFGASCPTCDGGDTMKGTQGVVANCDLWEAAP